MRNKLRMLSFISVITVLAAGICLYTIDRQKSEKISVRPSASPQSADKIMDTANIGGLDTADATLIEPLPDEKQIDGSQVDLVTKDLTVRIVPSTWEFKLGTADKPLITISQAQPAVKVQNLKLGSSSASWEVPSNGLKVLIQVVNKSLKVKIESSKETSITWPILGKQLDSKAMILPLAEGRYVPTQDKDWLQYLTESGESSLNEAFSMPFWGVQGNGFSLTYRVDNPFNDAVHFTNDQEQLGLGVKHDFTAKSVHQPYGVAIYLGTENLNEPAKIFRQTLQDRKQFVTLQDKIQKNPGVQKLLGAAHVYMWGSGTIAPEDITDWGKLAKLITSQAKSTTASPAKQVWQLLDKEGQEALSAIAAQNYADSFQKNTAARSLGNVLNKQEFYQADAWSGVKLDSKVQTLLSKPNLNETELYQRNNLLLTDAFPGIFTPVESWGDGISTKMLKQFQTAGLDRLWLGVSDWQLAYKHPEFVQQAESMGYLAGTYDSYNTVLDPVHPADPSFTTAIFDQWLYDKGAVVRADGKKEPGFQKKGYTISPLVTLPYMEKRFSTIMANTPLNSWFVDADGDGQLHEDYSTEHPATEQDDMNAKIKRLNWFANQQMVVGTEKGEWYTAPSVAFAHGMTTPALGAWMDKDMGDKSSKYYLGSYWPPEGPDFFIKPVPLKPIFDKIYVDPQFQFPLYELVYHDAVITTHHWGMGSLKISDKVKTRSLTELLYTVPPLYHLNLKAWEQDKETIKKYYDVFSPVHKQAAVMEMTRFDWLSPDRLIQKTTYGNKLEIVANYSSQSFSYENANIPAQSVWIHWLEKGETQIFTP
ncbi:glycoside hydrolase [Paenibacillus alba]|uniref:Glycoside hydrolase n=1 Tax=Paenibacillus alba TaxID=1197127 RepID=A0ABU6GBU7_9BACL|nr:glycoside hydrolase [Paenibacillus alba]MEC0231664.1 glycoside hydrolase [Paenibacillus alba]